MSIRWRTRVRLHPILSFLIYRCLSVSHRQSLLNIPSYIYEQPHVYSLEDLVKLKSRELQKIYEPIVHKLRDHVFACSLCYARGFICEICNNSSKIIFPFDIANTSVCPGLFLFVSFSNGKTFSFQFVNLVFISNVIRHINISVQNVNEINIESKFYWNFISVFDYLYILLALYQHSDISLSLI